MDVDMQAEGTWMNMCMCVCVYVYAYVYADERRVGQ